MKNELYCIIVLDKGFVHIGELHFYVSELGTEWIKIENCYNIRHYGTKEGLGQLALKGPTSETILDLFGTVHAPAHSLIFFINTKEELWNLKKI